MLQLDCQYTRHLVMADQHWPGMEPSRNVHGPGHSGKHSVLGGYWPALARFQPDTEYRLGLLSFQTIVIRL